MATNTSRRGGGAASALRKTVGGAVSSENVVDLIQRLGLLDIAVDKLRQRLESADVDEFFDDMGDYLKRNPEVIVVLLGTITVAVGMVVYLERQSEWRDFGRGNRDDFDGDEEEEEAPRSRPRAAPAQSAAGSRRRG
jgi:hypothetical protein